MSDGPRDRAWPMAACVAWMIASVGLVALTTAGPMLRPSVEPSPFDLSLALTFALAIGWPLLSANASTLALAGGQGAVVLAIDAATHERTAVEVSVALTAWLGAVGVAAPLNKFVEMRRRPRRLAWTTLVSVLSLAVVRFLG